MKRFAFFIILILLSEFVFAQCQQKLSVCKQDLINCNQQNTTISTQIEAISDAAKNYGYIKRNLPDTRLADQLQNNPNDFFYDLNNYIADLENTIDIYRQQTDTILSMCYSYRITNRNRTNAVEINKAFNTYIRTYPNKTRQFANKTNSLLVAIGRNDLAVNCVSNSTSINNAFTAINDSLNNYNNKIELFKKYSAILANSLPETSTYFDTISNGNSELYIYNNILSSFEIMTDEIIELVNKNNEFAELTSDLIKSHTIKNNDFYSNIDNDSLTFIIKNNTDSVFKKIYNELDTLDLINLKTVNFINNASPNFANNHQIDKNTLLANPSYIDSASTEVVNRDLFFRNSINSLISFYFKNSVKIYAYNRRNKEFELYPNNNCKKNKKIKRIKIVVETEDINTLPYTFILIFYQSQHTSEKIALDPQSNSYTIEFDKMNAKDITSIKLIVTDIYKDINCNSYGCYETPAKPEIIYNINWD